MSITFSGFHAHVYFSEQTQTHAQILYDRLHSELPSVTLGTFHVRNVGPHPSWMFTMSFETHTFQTVTLWLMAHLDGLSALIHPLSGDDLQDHTTHAMWFGKQLDLYIDKL